MRIRVVKPQEEAFTGDLFVSCLTPSEVEAFLSPTAQRKTGRSSPKVLSKASPPPFLSTSASGGSLMKHLNLQERLRRADFSGKDGESALFDVTDDKIGFGASTLLLLGYEGQNQQNTFYRIQSYRRLGAMIGGVAREKKATQCRVLLGSISLKKEEHFNAFLEGLILSQYSFDQYRSATSEEKKKRYSGISDLVFSTQELLPLSTGETSRVLCEATAHARDLINLSPRDCTPSYLVKTAQEIAKKHRLKIEVLDQAKLKKMKAGALLAVAQGSDEPPYLIKLSYIPKKLSSKKLKPIALVGKGVTFDSGGLSIKPAQSMEEMKMDMSGAAAVLGAMEAIAQLAPNMEVRAYIPTTENMINGKATRPGDVITSLSGKTIEVLNTDAEGRLILADAVFLAEQEGAETIIDVATLTGAVVVALGLEYAGLFTENDALAQSIQKAGDVSGEHFWRLPLATAEYSSLLKSKVADMKNIGGRWGGSITGALFIKNFVSQARWAHLDIAGTAYSETEKEHIRYGGVGFGVRTLVRTVLSLAS